MTRHPFKALARDWEAFGKTDPLFGILSDPSKHGGRWDVAEFFDSGRAHVEHLFGLLASQHIVIPGGPCLDFGCGVGRLTGPLSERFTRTVGVDVAPSMIDRARHFHRANARCEFVVNRSPDLKQFPSRTFGFVHSCLVLQHIAPAIAVGYIREFFRVAAPGGLVVFQLPAERRSEEAITALLALPDGGYAADIVIDNPPPVVHASQAVGLSLRVTNVGNAVWRHDLTAGRFLTIANHWLRDDGSMAVHDDGRTRLPRTLHPGESAEVVLPVTAPGEAGEYQLEIDLVQEAVCWFAQKGSRTARATIRVQPQPRIQKGTASAPRTAAEPPAAPRSERWRIASVLDSLVQQFRSPRRPTFSMYTVPRAEVEAVITECGAVLLAAIDDNAAGAGWQSYTYVCRR